MTIRPLKLTYHSVSIKRIACRNTGLSGIISWPKMGLPREVILLYGVIFFPRKQSLLEAVFSFCMFKCIGIWHGRNAYGICAHLE